MSGKRRDRQRKKRSHCRHKWEWIKGVWGIVYQVCDKCEKEKP